jgi:glycosyltransferase involved in cell wall biosynthesis
VWVINGIVPFPFHRAIGGIFDFTVLNHINQCVILPRLVRAIKALEFNELTLISYYPFICPVIKKINFTHSIFHIVDEWQALSGIPNSMAKLTKIMLATSDVTIVTSSRLLKRYKPMARSIHLLQHGTDISIFKPVFDGFVEPHEMFRDLCGTKIGYYGALHKLDYDIIRCVAESKPNWNFVFVGPKNFIKPGFENNFLPSNVRFVGPLDRVDLPKFLAALDVFWMPFVVNELTKSMSPIKIFEVMSSGLPIVSTDLEECRDISKEFGFYAKDAKSHLRALAEALKSDNKKRAAKQVKSVSDCDWDNRYKQFLEIISK